MHTCQECNTIVEVADLGYTAGIERFTVTNTPGVVPCARCLVIVVNLMSGEPLLASGDIDGWELPTIQRHPDTQVVQTASVYADTPAMEFWKSGGVMFFDEADIMPPDEGQTIRDAHAQIAYHQEHHDRPLLECNFPRCIAAKVVLARK